jgi:hypothetical protein
MRKTSILLCVILIIVCSVAGAAPRKAQHPKASNLQQAAVAPNDSAPKPMLVMITGVPSAKPKPNSIVSPVPTLSQWALILLCVSLTGIALRKIV